MYTASLGPLELSSNPVILDSAENLAEVATAKFFQSLQYGFVSVLCVVSYEWFANLSDEIRLVYPNGWSSLKIAYLLCRYYPLLYLPIAVWAYCGNYSQSFCANVSRPVYAFMAPLHFFGPAVMFMRSYAFSGRKQKVLSILSLTFGFLVFSDIYLIIPALPLPKVSQNLPPLPPTTTGCFPAYGSTTFGLRIELAIIAGVLLDFFSLVIVTLYCIKKRTGRTPLAVYFLKQGLVAFAWTTFTNLGSVLVYFQAHAYDSYRSGFGLPFILAISNLLACRLILSLRRRVYVTDTKLSRDNSRLIHAAFPTTGPAQQEDDVWVIQEPVPVDEGIQMDDMSGLTAREDSAA